MEQGRRQFLTLVGVGAAGAVAGCSGGDGTTTGDGTRTESSAAETATGSPTTNGSTEGRAERLAPADLKAGNAFGRSVALSDDGDRLVAGRPGLGEGAVYVFGRSDGGWERETVIRKSEARRLGKHVVLAADGQMAFVAAKKFLSEEQKDAGVVYVFERSGGSWTDTALLTPDEQGRGDYFGDDLAVTASGEVAVVGGPFEEQPGSEFAGAAYVFSRTDGSWTQAARLGGDTADKDDYYGGSVDIDADGQTVLVGAPGDEDTFGENGGAAYVYTRSDDRWQMQSNLLSEDDRHHVGIGGEVHLTDEGSTAVVSGAIDHSSGESSTAGTVYVLERSESSWTLVDEITSSNPQHNGGFGATVGLSADASTIVAAAQGEQPPGTYHFERGGDSWSGQARLEPPAIEYTDANLGTAIDVTADGSTAVVSAPNYERGRGIVFVYDDL